MSTIWGCGIVEPICLARNCPLPFSMEDDLRGSRLLGYLPKSRVMELYTPSELPDLYQLLQYKISPGDDRLMYENLFKLALTLYTFPVSFSCQSKIIKIIGRDNRFCRRSFVSCQPILKYKNSLPFAVSRDGMRTLCKIIRQDSSISRLMFISKASMEERRPLAENEVGDEAVEILAEELPINRFSMLYVGGAFGDKAATKFLLEVPYLLKVSTEHPNMFVYGEGITTAVVCNECKRLAGLS